MQFKRGREMKRTRVEIIPMIDTVFFLLVFFMLSSLSLTRLNGVAVQLPQTTNAPPQTRIGFTLSIARNGAMQLNHRDVTMQNLQNALRESANSSRQTLTINADERVSHGVVMRAVDAARGVGITRFSIATSPQ